MIAALDFETRLPGAPQESALEPGLHRIDEIMAAVLARYDSAALVSPESDGNRFIHHSLLAGPESSLGPHSRPRPR